LGKIHPKFKSNSRRKNAQKITKNYKIRNQATASCAPAHETTLNATSCPLCVCPCAHEHDFERKKKVLACFSSWIGGSMSLERKKKQFYLVFQAGSKEKT